MSRSRQRDRSWPEAGPALPHPVVDNHTHLETVLATTDADGWRAGPGDDAARGLRSDDANPLRSGEDREPEIVFGGTYASAWRNEPVDDRGTLFGYRMAAWGMEGGAGEHEPDESLTLEGMERGTRILARALAGLGGATD